MRSLTLISSLDAPAYNKENTKGCFWTPLQQEVVFNSRTRLCISSVVCPVNWAFQEPPPKYDGRFFLACDLFDRRALIGPQKVSHLAGPKTKVGHKAVFAFVPEDAEANSRSFPVVKNFSEWYTIEPGPPIRTVYCKLTDCEDREIVFKRPSGPLIVEIEIDEDL